MYLFWGKGRTGQPAAHYRDPREGVSGLGEAWLGVVLEMVIAGEGVGAEEKSKGQRKQRFCRRVQR